MERLKFEFGGIMYLKNVLVPTQEEQERFEKEIRLKCAMQVEGTYTEKALKERLAEIDEVETIARANAIDKVERDAKEIADEEIRIAAEIAQVTAALPGRVTDLEATVNDLKSETV